MFYRAFKFDDLDKIRERFIAVAPILQKVCIFNNETLIDSSHPLELDSQLASEAPTWSADQVTEVKDVTIRICEDFQDDFIEAVLMSNNDEIEEIYDDARDNLRPIMNLFIAPFSDLLNDENLCSVEKLLYLTLLTTHIVSHCDHWLSLKRHPHHPSPPTPDTAALEKREISEPESDILEKTLDAMARFGAYFEEVRMRFQES